MRIRIFIDFWNFQLTWNTFHQGKDPLPRIPWDRTLPEVLVRHVASGAQYMGTHVYASVDPSKPADKKLRGFLHVMNGFEGYKVVVKERKPAGVLRCPNDQCRQPIIHCPHCNQEIKRTVEKGVDTALAVDLIEYGLDNTYDRAILVAGDADFVPAVELIQRTGKQVVHAFFKGTASELMTACWSHVFMDDHMAELLGASTTT